MAENWKHLYEQMKKMVAMYQDEVVPGLRELLNQKWIPVTERLPEEDGQYLVFQKHTYGTYTAVLRFAKDARKVDKYDFHRGWENVWYRYDSEWGYLTIDDVTHWMPLPQPPKEEAQQDCTYNKDGHCTAQKLMPECDPKACDRRVAK